MRKMRMSRKTQMALTVMVGLLSLGGCARGDDDDTGTLQLKVTGLMALGTGSAYEGWIIVGGQPKSTGIFAVDSNGNLSPSAFDVNEDDLASATTFVLTIEPSPDSDPAPTNVHYLGGDFSGGSASLSVAHPAALGSSFTTASGKFILATPTDSISTPENERSGIWFLDPSSGTPAQGLMLPTLPAGWKYEGWAVIGSTPVTTGTFTNPAAADESAPFSGSEKAPLFPGEDFLKNAPSGLTFPTDLRGGTAVISIEPSPDDSPSPFTLKPLLGAIAADAVNNTTYSFANQASGFPTGTALIQ